MYTHIAKKKTRSQLSVKILLHSFGIKNYMENEHLFIFYYLVGKLLELLFNILTT